LQTPWCSGLGLGLRGFGSELSAVALEMVCWLSLPISAPLQNFQDSLLRCASCEASPVNSVPCRIPRCRVLSANCPPANFWIPHASFFRVAVCCVAVILDDILNQIPLQKYSTKSIVVRLFRCVFMHCGCLVSISPQPSGCGFSLVYIYIYMLSPPPMIILFRIFYECHTEISRLHLGMAWLGLLRKPFPRTQW